ncbi:MAG: response regulator [Chitinophagales bacterium]|nr:response regulator [Chitinophagales bacterium]
MAKQILVIEDNRDMLENIAEILELASYQVLMANNGKEGIRFAKEHKPDLILCDIMMPELDGYGVLKILVEHQELRYTPFIFMSAKSEKSDFREGMRLGADDYLTKPFQDIQLLEAIETRLKKGRSQGELKSDFTISTIDSLFNATKAKEDLKKIFDSCSLESFDKKTNIFNAGNLPRYVYKIESGMVKTSMFNEEGKELITGLYAKNDFVGLMDLFSNSNYLESAKFLSEGTYLRLRKEDFLQAIYSNKDLAMYIYTKLHFSLNIRKERMLHLAYDSVRKRTADALIWLDEIYNKKGVYPFKILFAREDLASMVGTAKESLIRTLSSFKEEGLIDTNTSEITIYDKEMIKNIVA